MTAEGLRLDAARTSSADQAGREVVARMLQHHGIAAFTARAGSVVWANAVALGLVAEDGVDEDDATLLARLDHAVRLPDEATELAPMEERLIEIELGASRAFLRLSAIAVGGVDSDGPVVLVTFRAPLEAAVDPTHVARLEAMLDSTSDIVTVIDHAGRIRVSNPSASRLTGLRGSDANGVNMLEFIHPQDAAAVTEAFTRGVLGGEPVDPVEVRIRMADGEWHHAEARLGGEVEIDGDPGRVVTVRDINDRVRRDSEMIAHRRRLESIVENIDDVIVILGPDLSVLWTSPGIERFVDAPAYTNVGESAFNDMHPDDVEGVVLAIETALEQPDGRSRATLRLRHERNGWRWIEAAVVNRVDDPAVGGLVCTLRDVTDRMDTSPELHRLREAERLEVDRLREADRLKDRFLATVSHELRTPLTSVRGFSSILEEQWDTLTADVRLRLIGRISVNARAMEDMIEQLLDFSRLHAGRVEVELQPLVVDDAVSEIVDSLEHQLRHHDVVVVPGGLCALAERRALGHVLRNLLTNAVRYSNPGTKIEVRSEREDDMVLLHVEDEGIGIAPKHQNRVYQSFFQAAPGSPDRRGTGIGLNVARRYAQLQNGSLTLVSELGVGSTFTLRLRAAD